MDQFLLGLDIVLILLLLLIGWWRIFSMMVALTLFGYLHDLPELHEFNAIMISVVVFFALAGSLVELHEGRRT